MNAVKMGVIMIVAAAAALVAQGCATKTYGRQGELTQYEKNTMTCREIELETAKVHGFLSHVDKESQFDGRSVLSFLGDFGIGNLMERSNAVESATARLTQLQSLRSARGCGGPVTAAGSSADATRNGGQITPASSVSPAGTHQVGRFSYEAEQLSEVRMCNPLPVAKLNARGPDFESFTVACTDGDAVAVRCQGNGCRVLQ